MRAKWLSPYTRASETDAFLQTNIESENRAAAESDDCGELELIFGEETTPSESSSLPVKEPVEVAMTWKPPAVKPKTVEKRTKMVTGLASLLKEKP